MSARGPSIAPRTTLAPSPAATGFALSPESASPASTVTSIVTSKEWVLPPRPKPGRKPSVDTPVSKRKAQNRAAQRAFRERRATRVQELEQQLLEVEKEKETKEMGLVNTINRLKFENQILSKSVEQLRQEFHSFRGSVSGSSAGSPPVFQEPRYNSVAKPALNVYTGQPSSSAGASSAYKADLNQTAQHLLSFAKSLPTNHNSASPALLLYSVQQILPAPSADSPGSMAPKQHQHHHQNLNLQNPNHYHSRPSVNTEEAPLAEDFECGGCPKELCLCEDVGLKPLKSANIEESFNSFAPMAAVSLRGKRKSAGLEVDFTAEFGTKKMPDLKRLKKTKSQKSASGSASGSAESFNENSPLENCGFCTDDTPCVCREAAKEAARIKELSERQEQNFEDERATAEEAGPTPLPPIQIRNPSIARNAPLPVMHPGLTFELRDISGIQAQNAAADPATPQNTEETDKSGCTGNPGTCSQCQTDPMSTLFCSTVASKAAQQDSGDGPVSAAGTPGGRINDYFSPRNSISDVRSMGVPDASNPGTPLPSTPGGSTNGIFIPCADAYRTLSRHKRFDTIDFSSLVGRLTTRGMQVEVQSVANMIRELDKKVYD